MQPLVKHEPRKGNIDKAAKFRIAYGTYGIPVAEPSEAFPKLASIGYEGIEINVGSEYPTSPDKLSKASRRELRKLAEDLNLEIPGLMLMNHPLAASEEERQHQLECCKEAAGLAMDLQIGDTTPVLATTIGSGSYEWESDKDEIADIVAHWGETISSLGTRLALEPHYGSILDTPERAVWLVNKIQSPSVGLNFDNSHFDVAGYEPAETIRSLAPLAIHTHVKDGRMEQVKVRYLLPGEGDTDYVSYFEEMDQAGWTGCITVEITAQIFRRDDYDPWSAAEFSWKTLNEAREKADI
jgi:sugar phosphate isomerase/epimerase